MSDNELLLALSEMIDKKLKPINDKLRNIEILQENDILPRIQNIEACYTSTYRRYANGVEQMDAMQADIEVMKGVIGEHSKQLHQVAEY